MIFRKILPDMFRSKATPEPARPAPHSRRHGSIPNPQMQAVLGLAACGDKNKPAADGGAAAAPAAASGNTILIGHFGSMTGSEATFGQSTDNGVRLAVKEVNAAGGINGKQIELKTSDDQG